MRSVKGKILLIYALLAIAVFALAGYSWYNSGVISARVEQLSQPDVASSHLKDIATNISRITNLYLKHSKNRIDESRHQQLIIEINSSLDALVGEYEEINPSLLAELDSIPLLLDSIDRAYQEIKQLRYEFDEQFRGRIGNEILTSLEMAQLTDSILIESDTQREVIQIVERELLREIPEERIDSRNFFQRLFSRKESESESTTLSDSLFADADVSTFKVTGVESDTLTHVRMDTVVATASNVQIFKDEVAKILQREQSMTSRIQEKEAYLYNINLFVIAKLESIINRFQREREAELRSATQTTLAASREFNQMLTYIVFVFGVAGLIVLWLLLRDIEKNRYYQRLLVKNEQQARLRAEDKQRFLSTMSHELRTPLTSIIGYTELMKDKDHPHVKAVRASATYLLQIANDILDIAKIEAGKIDVNPKPENVTEIFREIELKFSPLISNAGLRPEFMLPDEPLFLEVDALRMQQIFYNLLHNAIKFTTAGYVKFTTRIESVSDEEIRVTVRVADSGVGIPQNEIENIFNDYQQAGTPKDNVKGTGLGLGIVQRIISRLDGTIRVDSEPGRGSTFVVSFVAKKTTPIEAQSVSLNEAVPAKLLRGRRIYVLDDDRFITQLYQIILRKYGAEVTACNDPKQALQELQQQKPDVLITDIKMPGLSGIELVHSLERINCMPEFVVVASANAFFEQEKLNNSPLFDAVLLKPFSQQKLLKVLAEILGLDFSVQNEATTQNDDEKVKAGIDLSDLKKYTMDDPEFLQSLLENLWKENDREMQLLQHYLNQGEHKAAAENIHKLISRFGQIKATVSVDARAIENALRKGDEKASPLAAKLLEEWRIYNRQLGDIVAAEAAKP